MSKVTDKEKRMLLVILLIIVILIAGGIFLYKHLTNSKEVGNEISQIEEKELTAVNPAKPIEMVKKITECPSCKNKLQILEFYDII